MPIRHRFLDVNGIRMHAAEAGDPAAPLVILCHGFPECWYSWRHQLTALADAGFYAVAPDQRGYGETSAPPEIESYSLPCLTGDIVALLHELGKTEAHLVGHDWGSPVAWTTALLRPDLFQTLTLLSVPYIATGFGGVKPTVGLRARFGERQFYQLYFQEPGKAEAELGADVRLTMRKFLYSASGDRPRGENWSVTFPAGSRFIDVLSDTPTLPAWLTAEDLDYFVEQFSKSGFRGGLNWYRNLDRNWELLAALRGAKIRQRSLFVAGSLDAVITMYRPAFDNLEAAMPALTKKVLIDGAGHWIQQERSEEVNRLLLEFLAG